jgi:hypothetical protein
MHDEELFVVHFDLRAPVFVDDDTITHLHVKGAKRTVVEPLAASDRNDFRLHRLLFCVVGDVDAALRYCNGDDALDDNSIIEGAKGHGGQEEYGERSCAVNALCSMQ